MMDFLRSLAPQRVNSKSSASPALPSRFETARPPRSTAARETDGEGDPSRALEPSRDEPSPVDASPAATSDVDPSRPLEYSRDSDRSRGLPPSLKLQWPGKPPRYADNDSRGGIDEDRLLPRSARAVALADTQVARRGESDTGILRGRSLDASPLAGATPPLAAGQAERRRLGPAPLLPPDAGTAVRAASPAPRFDAPRAEPLSRDVVAARVTQRAEPRPVVHVTIDRIDVRMPATADRPKPPASARRSSAGESLGDYLRARQPDRRGGVS